MVRRKTIFYGWDLDEQFETALGFPDYSRSKEVLSAIGFETPQIDWFRVADKTSHKISKYAKKQIDFAFEAELGSRARKYIGCELSRELPQTEISEAEFLKKSKRIQALAQKLTKEIDELAEVGTRLIVKPTPEDGLTSAETPDQLYSQVTGKCLSPSSDDFFDYYSFRKLLDYFANFSKQNGDFNSYLSDRYDRMPDYSWYETFVRRVVLALWTTDFPMTVTIPTETNPDYSSPIILVLGELRNQFNQIANSTSVFADMHEDWSYRQHARLALKLREEFEDCGVFWTLMHVQMNKSEQSTFADKEA